MNNCSFIGRIGKDAAVRSGGKSVATGWSIAIDVGYGDNKQTMWIDCTMWGDRGEKVAPYIRKGDNIGVFGELGTREHDGKTYVTLRVSDVKLLGQKDGAKSERGQSAQRGAQSAPAEDFADSDSIPF